MAVYDDEKTKSGSRATGPSANNNFLTSYLNKLPKNQSNRTASSGGVTSSHQSTSPISASGLNNLEDKSSSSSSNTGIGENKPFNHGENFAYNSSTSKLNPRQRFLKGTVRGNRKFIVGGAGGCVVIGIFFAFAAIIPYELVHIEETLLKYEARVEEDVEKHVANDMIKHIIKRHLGKTQSEEDEAASKEQAEGEDLEADADSFNFESQEVTEDLNHENMTVMENSSGEFTGIEENGTNITDEIGNNTAVDNDLETALPEYDVGQIESLEPIMTEQAGASYDVLQPDQTDDVDKTMDNELVNGPNQDDLDAVAQENDENPSQKASQQEQADSTLGGQDADQFEKAEQAALKESENGGTEAQDINAGENAFHDEPADGGDLNPEDDTPDLTVGQIATDACSVDKVATEGAKERVPTIMMLLIRHAAIVFSLADQLKTGKITGSAVNSVMQLYNGDPSAKEGTEASEPFDASEGWQNAIGNTGKGVPIDDYAKPNEDEGTHVVDDVNSVMPPGSRFGCNVLTSQFGGIVQGLMGVGQFLADDATLGASQVAFTLGGVAFNEVVNEELIPDLLKYFTPIGLAGGEDSVQWMNNSDAGSNLMFNDYSRSMGGNPQTNTTADQQYALATEDQNKANSELPLSQRVFALSDPDSLISHLADDLPIGITANMSDIASYLSDFPSIIEHNFSMIIDPSIFAQNTPTNPGEPYGATQYGFTSSEIDPYDPFTNEQYLLSDVTADGKSVSRLSALGNPNSYQPSQGDDSNNQDLLHCYVDSFATIEEAAVGNTGLSSNFNPNTPPQDDPGADQMCGAVGLYDYTNTPPNSVDVPNDQTAVAIYCDALGNPSNCAQIVTPQVHNDVLHYRQYLIDTHVMSDYTSLASNQ